MIKDNRTQSLKEDYVKEESRSFNEIYGEGRILSKEESESLIPESIRAYLNASKNLTESVSNKTENFVKEFFESATASKMMTGKPNEAFREAFNAERQRLSEVKSRLGGDDDIVYDTDAPVKKAPTHHGDHMDYSEVDGSIENLLTADDGKLLRSFADEIFATNDATCFFDWLKDHSSEKYYNKTVALFANDKKPFDKVHHMYCIAMPGKDKVIK